MKIARKINAVQRQKKNLDGLYRVLAPGSTVWKVNPTTSVIEEPNRPEVRVQNSDIAIFGTRNERDTELDQYIERQPKNLLKKTLEQKIVNHKKGLLRKVSGIKKIKRNRKQTDDVSVLAS